MRVIHAQLVILPFFDSFKNKFLERLLEQEGRGTFRNHFCIIKTTCYLIVWYAQIDTTLKANSDLCKGLGSRCLLNQCNIPS